MRRGSVLVVTAVVVVAAAGLAAVTVTFPVAAPGRAVWHDGALLAASAQPSATPAPSPTTTAPFLAPRAVTVDSPGFWSWALLDTTTGAVTGSANLATPSDTASMSKAWVAADYLRRAGERGLRPGAETIARLSTMIRDSETKHTFDFHKANGNLNSIKRMITLCGLTETTGVPNSWSLTRMSARDVARLAACIGDGRAAGPAWTGWLLDEMRAVRGPGRFGVIEIAPAALGIAIKNGWLLRDDKQWHIACMAIGTGWTLAVMAKHAGHLGKDHGAGICRQVAEQLHGG